MTRGIDDFEIRQAAMRYSLFVPRLYNLCLALGFERGLIMPSRAFCSDESQGYPVILIAKHFGTFPFNHGRVGGIVATDRHAPHSQHGEDMVIIHASHVGYDPENGQFGRYHRQQTRDRHHDLSCGAIGALLGKYRQLYQEASEQIRLRCQAGAYLLHIPPRWLAGDRTEGLVLELSRLLATDAKGHFIDRQGGWLLASSSLQQRWSERPVQVGEPVALGDNLDSDLFHFRRRMSGTDEGRDHLEYNLLTAMQQIIRSPQPALAAAKVNTRVEFERTLQSLGASGAYGGRRVLFVSGINIDVSPEPGQRFPLTKFVPWAACYQQPDGQQQRMAQPELLAKLLAQSAENPDQIDLELAINAMGSRAGVAL